MSLLGALICSLLLQAGTSDVRSCRQQQTMLTPAGGGAPTQYMYMSEMLPVQMHSICV